MNKVQKRKIIGVAVISGVILVSVASVGAVKLVNEANATEVNKYVTAKNANYNTTYAVLKTITVNNYGGKGGTSTVEVCNSSSTPHYFFSIDGELQTEDEAKFTVPSRVGSSFKGYVDQDGNQICDSKGVVQMDFDPNYPNNKIANVTAINAKYDKTNDDYQFIALDRNGGTGGPDCIYVERGSTYSDDSFETDIDSIEVPTRTGYNFNGYNSSPGLIVKVDGTLNYSVIKNRYTGSHADYIATAEWIPYTHTVVFDANGGNDAPGNQTKTYGSAITLSSNIPTRTGYTFTGWNTKQDGTGTSYAAGGQYTADQNGGTVTLYAQWEGNVYKYTLNKDGGTGGTDTVYCKYGTGYYKDEECTQMITKDNPIEVPTKEGYTFEGYYVEDDNDELKVFDSNGYIEKEGTGAKHYTEEKIFYAQWEQNTESGEVTVTLDYQGGDQGDSPSTIAAKVGNTYGSLPEPTKDGKIFLGWYTESDGRGTKIESNTTVTNSSAHTLYAYYGQAIRITFDYDGATGGNELEYKDIVYQGKLGELPQPTKEGYTFDGWYSTKEFTSKLSPDSRVPYPVTIYAKWIKNEDENVAVTGIEVTPTSSEIKVGGTATITATVKPDNATNKNVTWSSSDSDVATVSNGVVTGKSEGTATITATTVDGNYTAEATITVKEDIEDTEGPTISSVKGEKDSDGKYKVVIKVTDESGIEKILVNGTEITTKDDEGNYYFIPTQNGEYKIEAFDTVGNSTEYTYTEKNIITETKITPDKDSEGNKVIYIETITNKEVDKVTVNGTEITAKDDEGRFCFKPSGNGTYTIEVTYKDGTTERKTYEETRFSENGGNNSGNNNNGGNNGNSGNSGNKDNSGSNGNFNNNGNSGNGTIGNKNNLNNLNNNGSNNTTGKTGDTITTSTALTKLPKTGTTMGALFAAIASGISAVIAWFKHKKMKQ